MNDAAAVLVYDGDCGFCTTSAAWMARHWPSSSRATIVPSHELSPEDRTRANLSEQDTATSVWWIAGDERRGGSDAIAAALVEAGGPWALVGRTLGVRPVAALARPGYRFVARHRQWLPGATDACELKTH